MGTLQDFGIHERSSLKPDKESGAWQPKAFRVSHGNFRINHRSLEEED